MLVKNERNSDIEKLISRSYRLFETGNFLEAQGVLNEAHTLDFENEEIKSALRACGFWQQRVLSLESLAGDGPRGDYLRRQWNHYVSRYRTGFSHPLDEGSARLKRWVHEKALEHYRRQSAMSTDSEALLQAGRCLKALGRYEESISTFEEALRSAGKEDARILADLADTYAMIGETKAAKVLMREALFLGASKIDLEEIASPLFRRLIDRLSEIRDVKSADFIEWLPVYGAVWSVFDVKRELTAVEYGKLKQTIYALKSEIADGDRNGCLTPRLINLFIRLIDHYQSSGADRSVIEEALINIKLLSPSVYREYFE